MRRDDAPPGLDFFWEQADQDGSGENPLERELVYRMDVLIRYQEMIEAALSDGRDDVLPSLREQHDRQAMVCEKLRLELQRYRRR